MMEHPTASWNHPSLNYPCREGNYTDGFAWNKDGWVATTDRNGIFPYSERPDWGPSMMCHGA